MATIALLDRYRTYSSLDLSEVEIWLKSLENAKEHFPYLSHELNCLEKFLGLVKIDQKSASVLRRIEQFTGAVMAKSMEDCYFYRYSALLSTCLVGSMPFDQPYSDAEIHAFFAKIQDGKRRPMTTLSTHDTKLVRTQLRGSMQYPISIRIGQNFSRNFLSH
jgi:Maltooligosyl trehalose synthase